MTKNLYDAFRTIIIIRNNLLKQKIPFNTSIQLLQHMIDHHT